MKSKSEHAIAKVFSGRWVWCITGALVFAYLACTGAIQPDNVEKIIGIILAFYFGQRGANNSNGGGDDHA